MRDSSVVLHVNVDHVATLRQARGTTYPDPLEAAHACERAGAKGITVHLREDKRHIQPLDVERIRMHATTLVNLEMAATTAMVEFALRVRPDFVTLVPEKREERTTEGGLDVAGHRADLAQKTKRLVDAGIPVSMFIDPEAVQIDASREVGATHIELHTGDFANHFGTPHGDEELQRLARAAAYNASHASPLHLAAGHGLTRANVVSLLAKVPQIVELNVGHAIVSDALLLGMEGAVKQFLQAMDEGLRARAK
jgi:pyridoxine 5-phosphate synthase